MLAAIHMPALESMSDFVRRLVDLARQAGTDIRLILLNREFFATDVMKTSRGHEGQVHHAVQEHRYGSRRS